MIQGRCEKAVLNQRMTQGTQPLYEFLCLEAECLHVHDDTPGVPWVVDSGASFHATPNKEFFSTYRGREFGIVKMGNEGYSKIAGVGDVCLETDLENKLMLKDVRHVPGLHELHKEYG